MTNATITSILLKSQLISLDEECARIMRFKKVCWFMGKLCVQLETDIANNNIPWAPTINFSDAVQVLIKYRLSLQPHGSDSWRCFSEHTEAIDQNICVAICKSLIAHERLG